MSTARHGRGSGRPALAMLAGMPWDGLFEDLEAQWEAQERRELDAEVADRTRRERALVDLVSRLVAATGEEITVRLLAGPPVHGRVEEVGDGWLLLSAGRRAILLVLDAVVAIEGLARSTDPATRARRFGVGYALRGISRDRAVVVVRDRAGGSSTGTIDVVGADHVELSVHPADEVRREANVLFRRTIPVSALVSVTSG